MKLRQFAAAAAIAMAGTAAHALPANTLDLGVDPFTEPFSAGTSLFVPGGVTTTFKFELTTLSNLFGQLKEIQNDVTVTNITLTGGTPSFSSSIVFPASDIGQFTFSNLSAGKYDLSFTATTTSVFAVYAGAVSVTPVPEAETYALALAGLGVVGLVAARRRKAQ